MLSGPLKDTLSPTVCVLILANLVPLIGVLFWNWSVMNVLLIFWAENLIIGGFNVVKMLLAGARHSNPVTLKRTVSQTVFFIVHYGMFTLVHGVALRTIFLDSPSGSLLESVQANFELIKQAGLWWACLALVISHGFSFVSNTLGTDAGKMRTPQQLMMLPYGRVLVLHGCVVLGALLIQVLGTPVAGLVVLVVMKIGLDVRAHNRQRDQTRT